MSRRSLRLITWLPVFLLLLALSWVAWPRFLLWRVGRELNAIYRLHRPFAYRWAGIRDGAAPIAIHPLEPQLLRNALTNLERVELSEGRTARSLQLRARADLLAAGYDRAVSTDRLALLLAPDDSAIQLDLAIGLALRAKAEHRALDYELALERILQTGYRSRTPEFLFDTALLFEEIPLPRQAVERWREAVASEPSAGWRLESQTHLASLDRFLDVRTRKLREMTASGASYLAHQEAARGALEGVVTAAIEGWLPEASHSPAVWTALECLAHAVEAEHHDPWLLDLLRPSPVARSAFPLLAAAASANSRGDHAEAGRLASAAERAFARFPNRSGALRSRLELVYSLDRRTRADECLQAVQGVRSEARQLRYVWMEAQAWLEEITCATQTRRTDVIALREQAYASIRQTGYEGLRLRALSFLTENYSSFGSRLRIWSRGREGLESFWNRPLPAVRGYQFYFTMARSAYYAGDREAAVALLRESTRTLDDSRYRPLLALLLADLGAWAIETGRGAEAVRCFDRVAELLGAEKPESAQGLKDEADIVHAQAEKISGHPEAALARLERLTRGVPRPYSSFPATVRRRLLPAYGGVLLSLGRYEQAAEYYRDAVRESRDRLQSVKSRAQRDNAQREIESAWRGLAEAYVRRKDPSQGLAVWEAFRAGRLRDPSPMPVQPHAGEILLAFAYLPGGVSGWLADSRGIEHRWLRGEDIRQAAAQFSGLCSDPDSPAAAVRASARRLYASLIQPFGARLPAGGLLVIDADGPLAQIPWAALEDDQGHALAERFAITQAAGWDEAQMGRGSVDFSRPLIVGEPALGPDLAAQFPPLIEALREAEGIHRRLPRATFLQGRGATFSAVAESAPGSTLMHFAGHGVSYGGFGALLLAPAAGDSAAAKLITADEIAGLELKRMQLVVLAACSSGAGEQSGAVNLDSLVRAFLEAGAARVLAARWNVGSPETAGLMDNFYAILLNGSGAAQALQQAALAVRRNAATSHPYYWAGFQVFGSP